MNDYVSVKILFQKKTTSFDLSRFFFKTLLSAKCNYKIYDKELLAIIQCFEKWKSKLQSINELIKILIDHKFLKYFMIIKKLNRRQIKWKEFFADFDFVVFYQTEKIHAKTNLLTKWSNDKSIFEDDDRQKHQLQIILTLNKLNVRIKKNLNELYFSKIVKISKNSNDSIDLHINTKKNEFESTKHKLTHKFFIFENKRFNIIKKVHNQLAIDHSNIKKIIQMLQKFFQWLKMSTNVDQYVRNCYVCRQSKAFKNNQHDQIQSIFVTEKSWQNISLNFVTNLLKNNDHNVILMIVDRFSKMRHYIVCRAEKKNISAKKQSNYSFAMFENCTNCSKRLYQTESFNLFF